MDAAETVTTSSFHFAAHDIFIPKLFNALFSES